MATHTIELQAEPRDVFGKHVRRLRRQGIVPANIYGHGDARPIQAPARSLEHMLLDGGRTGIVTIAFDGGAETALLKEIQRDPRSGQILHIEFQAVSLTEEVISTVPVRFVGESVAVTKLGGVLTHPRTELRLAAQAQHLPESIEVDVSAIVELHGAIHVSDLPESSTYKFLDPPEEVLAIVQPPTEEEVEAEAEAAEGAEAEGGGGTEAEAAPAPE
ncbi:MAG: 50S ribosomal protein L25 [Chloroflexi bacterium]|nr:50S ribosomal protein L25 [Chloroflexota bacterium]